MALEDEFGPINLSKVHSVCNIIDLLLHSTDRRVGLITSPDSKIFTNTIFAIGGYMIMHCDKDLDETMDCLGSLLPETIPYHSGSRNTDPIF